MHEKKNPVGIAWKNINAAQEQQIINKLEHLYEFQRTLPCDVDVVSGFYEY